MQYTLTAIDPLIINNGHARINRVHVMVALAAASCPIAPLSSLLARWRSPVTLHNARAGRIKGRRFNVPDLMGHGYDAADWRECAIAINRRAAVPACLLACVCARWARERGDLMFPRGVQGGGCRQCYAGGP